MESTEDIKADLMQQAIDRVANGKAYKAQVLAPSETGKQTATSASEGKEEKHIESKDADVDEEEMTKRLEAIAKGVAIRKSMEAGQVSQKSQLSPPEPLLSRINDTTRAQRPTVSTVETVNAFQALMGHNRNPTKNDADKKNKLSSKSSVENFQALMSRKSPTSPGKGKAPQIDAPAEEDVSPSHMQVQVLAFQQLLGSKEGGRGAECRSNTGKHGDGMQGETDASANGQVHGDQQAAGLEHGTEEGEQHEASVNVASREAGEANIEEAPKHEIDGIVLGDAIPFEEELAQPAEADKLRDLQELCGKYGLKSGDWECSNKCGFTSRQYTQVVEHEQSRVCCTTTATTRTL